MDVCGRKGRVGDETGKGKWEEMRDKLMKIGIEMKTGAGR